LAAILAADVVGYSRLMGADEAGTLAALKRHREAIFDPAVAAHNGRIVKLIGDGVIAEFGSVVDAVSCALSVQRSSATTPDQIGSQPTIVLRIGINLGDVIIEGDDIYGDGVNIAARLERSPSRVESASHRSSMKALAIGSMFASKMAAR
jgi:adenylate cyclase